MGSLTTSSAKYCPQCDSSNITKMQTTATKDRYMCKACGRQWDLVNESGQNWEKAGQFTVGALGVLAVVGWLFGGGSNNNNNNYYS